MVIVTFPVAQTVKNLPANVGDLGWIPGLGRSPGWAEPLDEGMATHSMEWVENSMDTGAWQATVPGVAKSQARLGD